MSGSLNAHFEHDRTVKLVRMANQIAVFFESQHEVIRVAGIAEHIGQFWNQKMRRDLYAHIDRGGEECAPTVVAAMQRLRAIEKRIHYGITWKAKALPWSDGDNQIFANIFDVLAAERGG